MTQSTVLMTGATGLMGSFFLKRVSQMASDISLHCLNRPTSNITPLYRLPINIEFHTGDSSTKGSWDGLFKKVKPSTILHIASIRHIPVILESLADIKLNPRLIVIGTTGVYSKYNQYSATYKKIEKQLENYPGSYCLLRPTMIYGTHKDKNLHKLIKFCDRNRFFPVFGSGKSLLQPVHADDLAQAILSVLLNSEIKGAYNLSGRSVVSILELLDLVEKLLGKSVYALRVPHMLGLWSATLVETLLGNRSPIRREQILRLQEDKVFSYEAAAEDFGYAPRSLEEGLRQEIEILRSKQIISPSSP